LLINTKEDGTVVKRCAAYRFTEIIKHNPKTRKKLLAIFSKIVKTEKNNGVKNIYLRALKILEK